jgi:hypothetical protein
MLSPDDYRQMADRSAQLAIACSAPSVARALLALSLDYMVLAAKPSQPAHGLPQMQPYDPSDGFGD